MSTSSSKVLLQKWNKFYTETTFPIGIECVHCKKWREVTEYQERSEVPENWNCSMWQIGKNKRGNCSMPSNFNENDFNGEDFPPGSLVWAKLKGYNWWPGMVEDSPDTQEFYQSYADGTDEYHVIFFGDDDKTWRSWVDGKRILDFKEPAPDEKFRRKKLVKSLEVSIIEAKKAAKMPLKERLKTYSFAVRYKGKWGKTKACEVEMLSPKSTGTPSPTSSKMSKPKSSAVTSAKTSMIKRTKEAKDNKEEFDEPILKRSKGSETNEQTRSSRRKSKVDVNIECKKTDTHHNLSGSKISEVNASEQNMLDAHVDLDNYSSEVEMSTTADDSKMKQIAAISSDAELSSDAEDEYPLTEDEKKHLNRLKEYYQWESSTRCEDLKRSDSNEYLDQDDILKNSTSESSPFSYPRRNGMVNSSRTSALASKYVPYTFVGRPKNPDWSQIH
ncbi:zinc finger CW-type PWWP domain protein 1 [Nephila pilipes]|uniref:Zinc finger CW-type PWWP domain protein 1 n=1 Tax=Nephila pilipes TaxID=299642 RepID=A0A8X6PN51_NEPPI|nr:zinc finger CW-type PWWP domain protein 1 [Nephila pilipes]